MKCTIRRKEIVTLSLLACMGAASGASLTIPAFLARRDYSGYDREGVAVADTNGDGIPDLIVNDAGDIAVLFGNGNGTFRSGPSTVTFAESFVAIDLNGDETVDLVIVGMSKTGWGIGVCLGNGDGTFQPAVFYQAGNDSGTDYLVVGDFNGDGIPDVATAGPSGIWLFTGKGDGTFNPGVVAVSLSTVLAGQLAAADFNRDGNLDLVVTMPHGGHDGAGAGFAVLLGNGNGTFQSPQTFAEPQRAVGLVVGALTKGGPASIALAESDDAYLYFGNGAGGFSGPHEVDLPTGTGQGGIAIGDVNGDGIPDLVSSDGYIAFGEGDGAFTKPVYYPVQDSNGTYNFVLADLRNNGLTDIVTDADFGVSVLLSEGKGAYEDGLWTTVAGGASCGVSADFNGDGKPDLAVITSAGVSILLGTGEAKSLFSTGTPIAVTGAACMVTGDLNGDGIPDLLVAVNGSPNALLSYLGNGDGTFTLKSTTATPSSGGYVVLADFNHDGKLDFATSGNLLALGNGDGTFQTPTAFVVNPPASGFSGIAAGDINNDGWPDVVLTNANVPYNNLFELLNNQKGGFSQVPTTFGALSAQPILADVNGDGNLDLILSAFDATGASVYLGNGQGGFTYQTEVSGPPGDGVGFNMVADLNGDGIPDIAVLESDTLAISLGEGGAKYATPFYIGTGSSPAGVLVANLHGQAASAGMPDILAPDTTGFVVTLLNLTK